MSSGRTLHRSRHQAVQASLAPLNLIASCLTLHTVVQSPDKRNPQWGRLSFPDNLRVPVAGPRRLSLQIEHYYGANERNGLWTVSTRSYLYHVFAADTEIVAFHWHPGVTAFDGPHAHFRHLNHPFPMGKAHIPTGRTSLESVVRLLVDELGVAPARPDWKAVLARTERHFTDARSWH